MKASTRPPRPVRAQSRTKIVWLVCFALAFTTFVLWTMVTDQFKKDKESEKTTGVIQPVDSDSSPSSTPEKPTPVLATALGLDDGADPLERLYLLRRFSNPLTDVELNAALSSLLALPGDTVDAGWHAEYIHEICLMLRRCGGIGEAFARGLITLSTETVRPLVIRDYALQHLATIGSDPKLADMRETISSGLADLILAGPPLAGTALLALHRLGDTNSTVGNARDKTASVSDERCAALAADLFASSKDTSSRMAAVRVVSDRMLVGQRDALRGIAGNAAEPTVLRMAAVAAIARLADPADAAFIGSIPTDGNALLAGALRHAAGQLIGPDQ